jgi:hypothetical protein
MDLLTRQRLSQFDADHSAARHLRTPHDDIDRG